MLNPLLRSGLLAVVLLSATACGRYGFEFHERAIPDGGVDATPMPDGASPDLSTPIDAGMDMQAPRDSEVDAVVDMEFDAGSMDMNLDDAGAPDTGFLLDMTIPGVPAVEIDPKFGLVTTELGGADTFTVRLGSAPTSDVTVEFSSSDLREVTVSPVSLTFTPANWESTQLVTVTGVADGVPDGNKPFTILVAPCVSSDVQYGGLDPVDVTGTNYDDATPGILVTPTVGLETTEAGGTATFTIVLLAQPETDVAIDLASSTETEGTVSPASAVFTTFNWNVAQEITVTGVDDFANDGDVPYTIDVGPASGDADYVGLMGDSVAVTNLDDDSAGFSVAPVTGLTGEDGTADTVTVSLSSQPTSLVTVTVSSSDTTEGTVSPTFLSFTRSTWNTPRTVTVTGVNDALADGNINYNVVFTIMATADPDYMGLAPQNVPYTNIDDDTPGITVSPSTGLVTTEGGGTATFSIGLNTRPTSDVTIALSSDNTSEGTVSPSSVTFTNLTYGSRTVTVTGVDDLFADGARVYHIVTAPAVSADGTYSGMNGIDATITNSDNDIASVVVTPVSGLNTSESGGTAAFSVRLTSQPSANVTISLMSSNTAEGTISLSGLTFTTGNWSVPQTVVVTGVNDTRVDGNVAYNIVTGNAVSTDMGYSGLVVADVAVTNLDNDVAGVVVTPTAGLVTSEVGGSASFTMVLSSSPTADVSIALSTSDSTEGTVSPSSVTFTSGNWNIPQTVMVMGVDDAIADGDIAYTIVTAAAASTDPIYNGLGVANVSATNTDNEIVGVTVTPTSGLVTSESGATATFTVVLDFAPSSNVSISLTSNTVTEGRVTPVQMTFTPANWNVPQTATVLGIRDGIRDGDALYTIVTSNAVSSDPAYNGRLVSDVSVTNMNVDVVGIIVTPMSGLTVSENRTTAQFLVSAASGLTGGATITLSSSDGTEGSVSPSTLYLNDGSWYQPQLVTVTGVDDNLIDGDIPFTIVTSAVTTSDPAYSGLAVPDVSVTNIDNDTGDVIVTPQSNLVVTEMGLTATFSVFLARAPTANVVVGLSSDDTGEGTVSPSSLTFTTANWATPRTVTVTGVADATVDGEQIFSIVTAPATSTDLSFSGFNGADVLVTNIDVDAQRCVSCNSTNYSPVWATLNGGVSVSSDGRYAGFSVISSPLIPSDTNGSDDAYLRDRVTNTLSVVSLTSAGGLGNSYSYFGAMSHDARYVLFTSNASNMVPGDSNGVRDAFLRDRMLNTTVRVSLSSTGSQLGMESYAISISDDGRYALFQTTDASAVPGDTNGWWDYFVRDLVANTTTRVSLGAGGAQIPLYVTSASMTSDGRYFVFTYNQSLLPIDANYCNDVYRRDIATGTLELVSLSPTGGNTCRPGYGSFAGIPSSDGRYIPFLSDTTDFVPGDTNGQFDTFLRDMVTGTITRVNVTSAGAQVSGDAGFSGITSSVSDDGRRVVFATPSNGLVPGDVNSQADLFVRDLMTGTTTMVTATYDGVGEKNPSLYAQHGQLTADGTGVLYDTGATNVLAEIFDSDTRPTVYYRTIP